MELIRFTFEIAQLTGVKSILNILAIMTISLILERSSIMKRLLLVLIPLTLFQSCGTAQNTAAGSCSNVPVLGTWHNTANGDTLILNSDCSGSGSVCGMTFAYSAFTGSPGASTVRVYQNNGGGGCLPVGDTVCAFDSSVTNTLVLNCGGPSVTFTR